MFKTIRAPIVVLTCVFLFSGCAAKTLGKHEEQVVIHETPNLTKAQVYDKAHQWFAKHYSNDKSKILHEDSNSGIIIGSGVVRIGGLLIVRNVEYKIKIEAKENEFNSSMKVLKYFNTDINGDFIPNEVTQGQTDNAHKAMSEVARSLERYINESAANDTNW
jgi:hypothetical protein